MEAAQPPPAPPKGIKTTSSMSMTAETPFSLKAKEDEGPYEAMCDFNIESVGISGSCTKVFGSSYGHILSHWGILEKGHPLDLSLATTGIILYTLMFLYPSMTFIPAQETIFLTICSVSVCFSVYLIYVLKFELQDFCVVCVTFHMCNFTMFGLAVREYRSVPTKAGNTALLQGEKTKTP